MNTSSDAAHESDQGQMMPDEGNYQINSVSISETLPTSIDRTLAEPELETFEFEVCTPYHGKPPDTADPHVAEVRIVEAYANRYQSRSPLVRSPSPLMRCRSPSQNAVPTGTPDGFLQRVIKRSRSCDAICEHREKGTVQKLYHMRGGLVLSPSSNAACLSIPETPEHSARQVRHRFRLHSQAQRAAAGPTVEVGEAPPENRVQALPQRQSAIYNPLIADVRVSRSSLIIYKTHCLYPEVSSLIPFPSCLIGFKLVVHPLDPKSRVKHLHLRLRLRNNNENQSARPPIIRAIYPRDGERHETGERTSVHETRANSIGVHLGLDQYGAATLSQTRSVALDSYTVACVETSGVCTSCLDLTMDEDTSSKSGVGRSVCFTALLELGSTEDKSFEATMTLTSKSRRELPYKLWASPTKHELIYDGVRELGCLEFHLSSLPANDKIVPVYDQRILLSSIFCAIIVCCGLIVPYIKTS
ncbi:hypothetical protein PCANC_17458 [Puccinia coronata f. sp. avenae]|uniref:Uncharacterized protein n=1 Tax=Puccinia coronata f. sp. avenae TaxID=200324 RepID=A0A2N5SMC1_9BASI|nr:hypothetical protein PCANC_17458 [Puccinia coronata f. sp. avenae]PLW41858.1 hypothetical protein PCASD_05548 [Puccinia coronata f. sp. avenae]